MSGNRRTISRRDTNESPLGSHTSSFRLVAIDNQGRFKIGISKDPEQRVKQLNTGNADELKLVYTKKAPLGYQDEAAIHTKLKDFNIRSEWFNPDALDVAKAYMEKI